jgi:large conductance mechanosensitive channel
MKEIITEEIIKEGVKKGVGDIKHVAKKSRNYIDEFKDFISRGNVVDLAVGVIIGAAFGKIVSSLVDDIIMPLVGVLIGGHNFSGLSLTIGSATIAYGSFIQDILDFLIIAAAIFIFVKAFTKMQWRAKKPQKVEEDKLEKKGDEQLEILRDIRSELRRANKK